MHLLQTQILLGPVGVEKVDEEGLFLLEGRFHKIEHKGQRHKAENVDLVGLAVFIQIFEQVLLVRQFIVMLEVVQTVPKDAVVYTALIVIVFVALLPPQIHEGLLAAVGIGPARAVGQDSPD